MGRSKRRKEADIVAEKHWDWIREGLEEQGCSTDVIDEVLKHYVVGVCQGIDHMSRKKRKKKKNRCTLEIGFLTREVKDDR